MVDLVGVSVDAGLSLGLVFNTARIGLLSCLLFDAPLIKSINTHITLGENFVFIKCYQCAFIIGVSFSIVIIVLGRLPELICERQSLGLFS